MQTGPEFLVFSVLILIFSVIIHEVAHGWAAYAQGDPTAKLAKRLTLNPFRHIDPIGTILVPVLLKLSGSPFLFGWAKPVPYNPYNLRNQRWGEALVAVAGVATNLFLAVVFGLLARHALATGAGAFGELAALICLVNLFLGIFNLLPIPPLDGYTFLRSVLPLKTAMSFREFEDRTARGGFLTLIVMLLVFSYFLAKPFTLLVLWVFGLIVGPGVFM
ncbi:MAG TPA: site-2 protease family protein [Candidatus Paceibacterota bacterium]|jgi:Zn-dependent protease